MRVVRMPKRSRLLAIVIGLIAAMALVLSGGVAASADDAPLTFTTLGTGSIGSTPTVGFNAVATWTQFQPAPDSVSFQWYVDGSAVSGTNQEFGVTPDLQGHQLAVAVTAHKAGYADATVESDPETIEGHIIASGTSITGVPKLGNTIGVDTSAWTPSGLTFTYQWHVGGVAVPGATDSTYTVSEADQYEVVYVTVTGSKDGYSDTTVDSRFIYTDYDTVHADQPILDGRAEIGYSLSVIVPTWIPQPPSYQYQWQSDGEDIEGATNPTYPVTTADVGHRLDVVVRGTPDGFPLTTVTSGVTYAIEPSFASTATPIVSGTPQLGRTLQVNLPGWSPAPTSVTYQWSVGGEPVSGATDNRFTPTDANEVGQPVTVQVTAQDAYDGQIVATSASTSPIAEGSVDVSRIRIGTVRLNRMIVPEDIPVIPADTPLRVTWMANGVPIAGATGETYIPVAADYGKKISVVYTIDAPGWVTSTGTSNAELARTGILTWGGGYVTGTPRVGDTLTVVPYGWGPAGVTYKYEWLDMKDPFKILSTKTTYTLQAGDRGHRVLGLVEGSEKHFSSFGWLGDDVTVLSGNFASAPLASVTGTPAVGQVLTAHHTASAPATGVTYSYQWFEQTGASSPAIAISKATSSTYRLGASKMGYLITVRVTASKKAYVPIAGTSSPTTTVAAAAARLL